MTLPSSPHIRAPHTTGGVMRGVLLALAPSLAAGAFLFGPRALVVALVCTSSCAGAEALFCLAARRPLAVADGSAAVTGLLLALTLPASVPLWIAALGGAFAALVCKALAGGIGRNVFNPALAARAFLLLAFPAALTRFPVPGADALSSATPLHDMVRPALPDASVWQLFFGSVGGCIGETCVPAILLGGIYLLARRVISPRIPLAFLGALALTALLTPHGQPPLAWAACQLFSGGAMFAAWFMATDYAAAPASLRAQFAYGALAGALTALLRGAGLYPESVTYAILLANAASWALDWLLLPGRFGAGEGAAV